MQSIHSWIQKPLINLLFCPSSWKWEQKFLQENMIVNIVSYQGEILGINLPNTVELKVTETEPGVKGNTAQGRN